MSENGKYTLDLEETFAWEEKEWDRMDFNFDNLTGQDSVDIEKEMQAEGIYALQNEGTDGMYQLLAAAKASGIPADVLKNLPLKKNQALKRAARRYLTGGVCPMAEEVREKLEKMSGQDAEIVENELRAEGHVLWNLPAMDTKYCLKLSARAAEKTEKELLQLPMDEFLDLKMAVRYFCLGVG